MYVISRDIEKYLQGHLSNLVVAEETEFGERKGNFQFYLCLNWLNLL